MPLDIVALQQQGLDFMLKQAANWARIPTRLNRADAARVIVQQAALQQRKQSIVNTMDAARAAISQTRQTYDAASSKVADVVDAWRAVPPGTTPPLALLPKAAEVVAIVGAVTGSLTEIERQIASDAKQVLTPLQLAQLNTGLSFPTFMGAQAKNLAKYLLIGGGLYLAIYAFNRSGGTRHY